jgi:hypothetical protein
VVVPARCGGACPPWWVAFPFIAINDLSTIKCCRFPFISIVAAK